MRHPGRCVSPSAARDVIDKWRGCYGGRGTVVWTNGVFDLLHAGHVQTLDEARDQGGLLIVGVNSDSSVRGLKGPFRPVIPEGQRAAMLCALRCVDLVVVFDDPTPVKIVRQVNPDVIVAGYGQGGALWPIELAAELEARLHTVTATGWYGVSTTEIIRRIGAGLAAGRGPK